MNFKLNPLYKRLIAFLIVMGPIYWLIFTEDGQRRTDSVVLYLWGEDEIKFNLKALDDQFTEKELLDVFPDIDWQCTDKNTSFGNRLCSAKIGIYNSIPAHYITVFFHNQWINGVKIGYRRIYHNQLLQQLLQQLGEPVSKNSDEPTQPDGKSILHWDTDRGNIILKKVLNEKDEPALFWFPYPTT
jgi:hypothetical protein